VDCPVDSDAPESTSLKWGADGELTARDLQLVMARLLACDQEAQRIVGHGPCR